MRTDFVKLLQPGGPMSVLRARTQYLGMHIGRYASDHDLERLGHTGLPGEFSHGIGITLTHISSSKSGYSERTPGSAMILFMSRYYGYSKRHKMDRGLTSEWDYSNVTPGYETAGEAIPARIAELRKWLIDTRGIAPKEKFDLAHKIHDVETSFKPIQAFARRYYPDMVMFPRMVTGVQSYDAI